MENFMILVIGVISLFVVYKIGYKKGKEEYSPFGFGDRELGVFFQSGKTHDETVEKITNILLESKVKLEEKDELLNRMNWLFYWFCDTLHNTGHNHLGKKELSKDDTKDLKLLVGNARTMLSWSRNVIHSEYMKDNDRYLAFLTFLEIVEERVTSISEQDFHKELEGFDKKFFDRDWKPQLSKPTIVKLKIKPLEFIESTDKV